MFTEVIFTYIFDERFLYQALATLTTYSFIYFARFYYVRHKRYQIFKYYGIPGPKPGLFEGNLKRFREAVLNASVDDEHRKEFGKIYGYFIGDEPTLVISDVDLLRKVFFDAVSSFQERSHVFVDSPLGRGLLFAKHHRWKAMRKAMTPGFSSYTMRGGKSTEFIEDSIRLMLKYLEQRRTEAEEGKKSPIDIQRLMKATALHLISEMAVKLPNVQVTENDPNVESLDGFLKNAGEGPVVLAIRFPIFKGPISFLANNFVFGNTLKQIRKSLNKMIDEGASKNDDKPKQLIDLLVKLHHEGKMTRDEVIGNAETILIAGYDTTSTTLTYVFWVLSKYPDIQKKLREELMAHGVESKYLEQVIHETMRLYPTVTIFTTRLATKTVKIDNLVIPQGCRVVFHAWIIHRDPELWPDPLKFDPDRFRPGAKIHPCAFAPFGLGERKCIGYQLAMLEMKMAICDILLRYKLNFVAPQELELATHGVVLTMPKERVFVDFEKL